MDTQKRHHEHGRKENTNKEMFPKGWLGPILGASKQYEPPYQYQPPSWDGDRLNSNGLVVDDDDKTNKAAPRLKGKF